MAESAQEVKDAHGDQHQLLSTATGDGEKTTDEAAASIILKNTPPSSPYKSAICSPAQMSPSTKTQATSDEVQSPSKAVHDVENSSSTSMDANVDSQDTPHETTVADNQPGTDQQAADVKPASDDNTGSKSTESSAQADNIVTVSDKTAESAGIDVKVDQATDDQKQKEPNNKKSGNKNAGDQKKSSNEGKAASTKSNNRKNKDRSPLGSRVNRRNSNNDGYNNRAGGYNNAAHNNYVNRVNSNQYSGSYNNGGSRYNGGGGGYPSGGYRQQNRYHRTTVQNNYGLKSPPYKSNFEPSDSARQRADEFVRASIGTM